MSIENWKIIQSWAGTTADGIPGAATAKAIIAKAGLKNLPEGSLVKGTGKAIRRIFIHCTATREGQDFDAATIKKWHLRQGWSDIGYHFVIQLDGTVERGRPEHIPGSHARGFNSGSIAVVYVGGIDSNGKAKDTRTPEQLRAMAQLVGELVDAYPLSEVLGHRDISPDKDGDGIVEPHEWLKMCPCFDVKAWWKGTA